MNESIAITNSNTHSHTRILLCCVPLHRTTAISVRYTARSILIEKLPMELIAKYQRGCACTNGHMMRLCLVGHLSQPFRVHSVVR